MSDLGKPMISKTTKDLLAKVRWMVPPMLEKFHKGTSIHSCGAKVLGLIQEIEQVNWEELLSLEEAKSAWTESGSPHGRHRKNTALIWGHYWQLYWSTVFLCYGFSTVRYGLFLF